MYTILCNNRNNNYHRAPNKKKEKKEQENYSIELIIFAYDSWIHFNSIKFMIIILRYKTDKELIDFRYQSNSTSIKSAVIRLRSSFIFTFGFTTGPLLDNGIGIKGGI